MKSHEMRLERLEAADQAEQDAMDVDAIAAVLGLSAADIAEVKRWAATVPAGLSEWELARLAGEEFGIHPGDILAEAREIMALVETLR